MDKLIKLLQDYRQGDADIPEVIEYLKNIPFENLSFAHVDHHRSIRQGFPEVIYCAGKEQNQVSGIVGSILTKGNTLLATRADKSLYAHLKKKHKSLRYNSAARIIYTEPKQKYPELKKKLIILTAGTTDIPVAEEAYQTAYAMGFDAEKIYDVGVAGIHRLFSYRDAINSAAVIIVIAGMEGALASVVGGMVSVPVIAVPTSGGYGTSFGGVTALLAMLNSCASGVTVVNIDNGFGAAFAAGQILRLLLDPKSRIEKKQSKIQKPKSGR